MAVAVALGVQVSVEQHIIIGVIVVVMMVVLATMVPPVLQGEVAIEEKVARALGAATEHEHSQTTEYSENGSTAAEDSLRRTDFLHLVGLFVKGHGCKRINESKSVGRRQRNQLGLQER